MEVAPDCVAVHLPYLVDSGQGATVNFIRGSVYIALGVLFTLCGFATNAQVLRQLTNYPTEWVGSSAIDDAGSLVVAVSSEVTDSNPLNEVRLVGWDLPGGSRFDIVPFPVSWSTVSVSDDGQWVAFVSSADPMGQNLDGGFEIFLASVDGSMVRQMTDRPSDAAKPYPLLTGSANRLLYRDTIDPLGTNPDLLSQLFVVDFDGTGLRQLTAASDPETDFCGFFSIDDLGRRVVFAHSGDLTGENPGGTCQLFRVNSDGSSLSQWTSGDSDSAAPALAGNGSRVAYVVYNDAGNISSNYVKDWDSGTTTLIEGYGFPKITDDGQWVYSIRGDENGHDQVYKFPADGGPATQVTFAPSEMWISSHAVSGSNTRVGFALYGDYPGGNNPDRSIELMVIDPDGTGEQQLTDMQPEAFHWEPDITPDGQRVIFSGCPIIRGGFGPFDLYRAASDGSDLVRLTTGVNGFYPSISGDGQTIVFSRLNLGIHRIQADGSGLAQITPLAYELEIYPVMAKATDSLVFQASWSGAELHHAPLDGSSFFQVTDDGDGLRKNPRVDYNDEWVVYHSGADPFGSNPDRWFEVFRIRTDGTGLQQLTEWGAYLPDISADGGLIVYESLGDPLGLNPDGNFEIFLYSAETGTTQQLTVTSTGESEEPRISGNGRYVYFTSTSPFFEPVFDGKWHLYRIEVQTGRLERADGLPDPGSTWFTTGTLRNNPAVAVDESGDRVVFTGHLNGTRANNDLNAEVFLADFSALPTFEISGSSPTVLRWDPDPRGVSYDVIRGDLANLRPGEGSTVDLGTVVCLEQDSDDTTTAGFEDPTMPAPGQGFFFLYRWTQGTLDGPGSWGQGTGGAERVAEAEACAP